MSKREKEDITYDHCGMMNHKSLMKMILSAAKVFPKKQRKMLIKYLKFKSNDWKELQEKCTILKELNDLNPFD